MVVEKYADFVSLYDIHNRIIVGVTEFRIETTEFAVITNCTGYFLGNAFYFNDVSLSTHCGKLFYRKTGLNEPNRTYPAYLLEFKNLAATMNQITTELDNVLSKSAIYDENIITFCIIPYLRSNFLRNYQ